MLTVIISTRESERTLVPTLAALIPGATAGLVSEAIIADANSTDATAEVADVAGCAYLTSAEPVGARLRSAAARARGRWLLFLRAGIAPDSTWVAAAERFIADADRNGQDLAAVFGLTSQNGFRRSAFADVLAMLHLLAGRAPRPDQGLLISRRLYDAIGGHPGHDGAEAALLATLGRRRLAILAAAVTDRGRTNT